MSSFLFYPTIHLSLLFYAIKIWNKPFKVCLCSFSSVLYSNKLFLKTSESCVSVCGKKSVYKIYINTFSYCTQIMHYLYNLKLQMESDLL